MITWIIDHWLEIFGALAGIIYVLLEIRQNIWLWPVGIVTSSVYMIVFFTSKFYADMSLQVYYLVISFYGWYIWSHGTRNHPEKIPATLSATDIPTSPATSNQQPATSNQQPATSNQQPSTTNQQPATSNRQPATSNQQPATSNRQPATLIVSRTPLPLILKLAGVYLLLHAGMWYILARHTDSPVAGWDSFTTALSVIATWMLARKYIEHWIIWIVVNIVSMILYIYKGLYPTTALFLVYTLMAVIGYREWRRVKPA